MQTLRNSRFNGDCMTLGGWTWSDTAGLTIYINYVEKMQHPYLNNIAGSRRWREASLVSRWPLIFSEAPTRPWPTLGRLQTHSGRGTVWPSTLMLKHEPGYAKLFCCHLLLSCYFWWHIILFALFHAFSIGKTDKIYVSDFNIRALCRINNDATKILLRLLSFQMV